MRRDIDKLREKRFDLLVIGGGINGAAVAHIASHRGLSVALLEKGDFASGTSSKSTKLIHGGIRYLENLELDLVYESLHERKVQLQTAPHLVRPLGIIIPVYDGDKRPFWQMKVGVSLYDFLAGKAQIRKHRTLTAKDVLELAPYARKEGLCGGVLYYDAQMDDFRLCLENVLAAEQAGAEVANYVEVVSFIKENGKVVGVRAVDLLGDLRFDVHARNVVCALGPWTNQLLKMDNPAAIKRVRMTKGVHIVYPGRLSEHGFLIPARNDDRVFFVLPWMGNSLIGTTDTTYTGPPDQPRVNQEDVDYLLSEAGRVFPEFNFDKSRIISVFAGLRPLIRRGGSPSKVSRKHLIYRSGSGIRFVIGGKYTTYRKVAVDCVDQIKRDSYGHKHFRLWGGGVVSEAVETIARECGFADDIVVHLKSKYGIHALDIMQLAQKDPGLRERVSENPPVIKAQIVYAKEIEMARTQEDVLSRLSLNYFDNIALDCIKAIDEVLGGGPKLY